MTFTSTLHHWWLILPHLHECTGFQADSGKALLPASLLRTMRSCLQKDRKHRCSAWNPLSTATPLCSSDEGQYKCPAPPGSYRYIFPIPWRFLWIYLCFFICMFFDLYSFSNVFCFVWIGFLLIPAHESLSAEEVICQVIVYRTHDHAFIHHKVGSPSVSKSSLCPESSNKSILYRQIFVPSEKRILVLENPKTDLPNSNQSTKIAYSNLRTFC